MKKIGDLFSKLLKSAPIDAAADQMSLEFFHTSLPPVLEEGIFSIINRFLSLSNELVRISS